MRPNRSELTQAPAAFLLGNSAGSNVTEPCGGSRRLRQGEWVLGPVSGLAEKGRWSSRCVPLRWAVRWSPP